MRVQFAGGSVVALLITVGVVSTSATGCSERLPEEERGHTASDFIRLYPGRGQLPPSPRIAGPLEQKGDKCDVPRGADRGEGCDGKAGDVYTSPQTCNPDEETDCPPGGVRGGRFRNETTDPEVEEHPGPPPGWVEAEHDPSDEETGGDDDDDDTG
jgi:hypothetical protein